MHSGGWRLLAETLAAAQGMTQPLPRLSERNLIAAMERHGIGTDATVADHIKKQLDRGYATKDAQVLPMMLHDKVWHDVHAGITARMPLLVYPSWCSCYLQLRT